MPEEPTTAARVRAVSVVLAGDEVVVIHRIRAGDEYWVLPGGGVEFGESIEDACVRELAEETGLRGVIRCRLPVAADDAYFVLDAVGELQLGGPELQRQSADNVYEPVWASIDELLSGKLVPEAAGDALRLALHDR